MTSKLSFRARQVDYSKPLPIYLNHDLPDLQDFAAINRSVPQMPTGMEKDEEAEHHLQRALSALQAFGANGSSTNEYAIPTPKVEIDNKVYESIYNIECPKQKQYIRIQPFSDDCEYPDYDADYDDEKWLTEQIKLLPNEYASSEEDMTLFFETIMDRLEKTTSHSTNIMSLEEAKFLLMKEANSDSESDFLMTNMSVDDRYKVEKERFILNIYEYWKAKRIKLKHPLTPIILTDKSGVVTQPNNPYLVFRRRTEKMQTRKNRKNEEQSYEKMLILKRDLCKAQQILKLIKKRENLKKEFLKITLESFEKRFKSNDYDGSLTESIKCSLKPAFPNTAFPNTVLSSEKNQSAIDKTIANLIHSNKLKNLGSSPQQGSFKKVSHSIESDKFYGEFENSSSLKSDKYHQQQQKQRLKKDKLLSNTTNTNSLLINNNNKSQKIPDSTIQKLKNQNLLKQHLKQQQQNNIIPPRNQKLTVNNLTQHQLNINKISAERRMDRHNRLNQLHQQQPNHPNLNYNLLSNKDDLYDSENNYESPVKPPLLPVHTLPEINKKPTITETNNNNIPNKSSTLDSIELNKRLLTINSFNIDLNDLNECNTYDNELKLNNVENLEAVLSDARTCLATSSEKDGYWCFKRKEGCRYLPHKGAIFKSEDSTTTTTTTTPVVNRNLISSSSSKKLMNSRAKSRLKQLQYYYYGYAITKKGRNLGLVRRRIGRGGRILFERFNRNILDLIESTPNSNNASTTTASSKESELYSFNYFSKFKTYYPKECFQLEINDKNTSHELERLPPTDDLTVPGGSSRSSMTNLEEKLKLKSFYKCLDEDENEITFDNDSDSHSSLDEDEEVNKNGHSDNGNGGKRGVVPPIVYDHSLFPVYQLAQSNTNTNVDSFLNSSPISTSSMLKKTTISFINETSSNPNKVNNYEEDTQDFTTIDDYFSAKMSHDEENNLDDLIDEQVYSNSLLKLNMRPSLALNDEFNKSNRNCGISSCSNSMNAASVKFALRNFQSIPIVINSDSTAKSSEDQTVEVSSNASSDDRDKEVEEEKENKKEDAAASKQTLTESCLMQTLDKLADAEKKTSTTSLPSSSTMTSSNNITEKTAIELEDNKNNHNNKNNQNPTINGYVHTNTNTATNFSLVKNKQESSSSSVISDMQQWLQWNQRKPQQPVQQQQPLLKNDSLPSSSSSSSSSSPSSSTSSINCNLYKPLIPNGPSLSHNNNNNTNTKNGLIPVKSSDTESSPKNAGIAQILFQAVNLNKQSTSSTLPSSVNSNTNNTNNTTTSVNNSNSQNSTTITNINKPVANHNSNSNNNNSSSNNQRNHMYHHHSSQNNSISSAILVASNSIANDLNTTKSISSNPNNQTQSSQAPLTLPLQSSSLHQQQFNKHFNQIHHNTNNNHSLKNIADNTNINVNILNTKKNMDNLHHHHLTSNNTLRASTNFTTQQNGMLNSENNDTITSSSSISSSLPSESTTPTSSSAATSSSSPPSSSASENKNMPMEVT